jgi:pimeloyl-ACP methyl ester carboxylesterase
MRNSGCLPEAQTASFEIAQAKPRRRWQCRIFACTLPGFGPSEKSPQVYTTALWKSYVRDFVVHVIQESTFIAGNSIGGVIPANACADHPHLFKGIILINTAGNSDREYDPESEATSSKVVNKAFVNVTSWLVFQYLQRGIAKQLQRLYPTRPFNADKFLNDEIFRASCDPGALQVCPLPCGERQANK